MLHVLCANERCSFILSCDGADQTSHEEGEEEKLERQCRAVSRACMQEEVGTARAQRACVPALDLPAYSYSRSKTLGLPPWCTYWSSIYCTTGGRPLQLHTEKY